MGKNKDEERDEQEGVNLDESSEAYQQASAAHCDIPPIDLTTFVLSLSTQALIQLGEVTGPDGTVAKDLMMARHTIDLLALLEAKTKGNLTGEEEQLLQQVLYDLRMRFVTTCNLHS